MARHRLEVADVFRGSGLTFLNRYGKSLSLDQHRALRAITLCRTKVLGGHINHCGKCGYTKQSYNSCRNRHCPKCQTSARVTWMEARATELLPVPYFHIVFALPQQLGPLALQNKRIMYGILFRAAWETVRDLTQDPKYLGAKVAMLSVLHTWGSNLMHHPHLHCIVPGGGISHDGKRWISVKQSNKRKPFFLPVRVMSRVFRGKFIKQLKAAYNKGQLAFHGKLKHLNENQQMESLLSSAVKTDWIVYCKRPFGGPRQVLKYLARYTHRVAISNSRLVDYQSGIVRFRWKDYRHGNTTKIMRLESTEFMRRFLLHVLPSGFVRIRHHGFLANRNRNESLGRCRELLGVVEAQTPATPSDNKNDLSKREVASTEMIRACPKCQTGRLQFREVRAIRGLTTCRAMSLFARGVNFQDSS